MSPLRLLTPLGWALVVAGFGCAFLLGFTVP